ncbi:MAG: murein L,D-transpeptidase catalytic domain family protein [Bacteroidales bacterium]
MRKTVIYLLFAFISWTSYAADTDFGLIKLPINDLYTELNLSETGLSKAVFDLAIKGLDKLDSTGKLQNATIVTIADYSQSSNRKRLYVIDLKNKRLLFNTYVAHGRNTGEEYAHNFSNLDGSSKSSMGFYVTEHPIVGGHTGFALLINGMEKGYNDNALRRAIIIHAANYATSDFIKRNGRLGRSLGCPALPPDLNRPIIDTIKGGTCLFIYTSDNRYLASSALLN